MVEKNINAKKVKIVKASSHYSKGDNVLIYLFKKEKYDVVATDDAKLIRILKMNNIPFILPALIIYNLLQRKIINPYTAFASGNSSESTGFTGNTGSENMLHPEIKIYFLENYKVNE